MAMQKLAQSFTLAKYRRRVQRESKPLHFGELLEDAQRVLVCLPQTKPEYDRMISSLAVIRKGFPKAHVTLLQSNEIPVPTEMVRGFQLLVWGSADVDRWGRPTASFRKRIFAAPFNVAIDLNRSVHFFSLAVVMESASLIRAGYDDPMREELYNFLLRSGTLEPAHALKAMMAYLGRPEASHFHR